SRLHAIWPCARERASSETSCSATAKPDMAATWAMPCPMVPAPSTAIRSTDNDVHLLFSTYVYFYRASGAHGERENAPRPRRSRRDRRKRYDGSLGRAG